MKKRNVFLFIIKNLMEKRRKQKKNDTDDIKLIYLNKNTYKKL